MYRHILLAADGSENSIRAAKEAVKIASMNHESFIELVYVVDFDQSKSDILHTSSSETLQFERRKKIQSIEALLLDANIDYSVTILHGQPGPEIVKYANKKAVDLVVIGSRGLSSLQEMVLGSVSHKVMKRVNCPALIVK